MKHEKLSRFFFLVKYNHPERLLLKRFSLSIIKEQEKGLHFSLYNFFPTMEWNVCVWCSKIQFVQISIFKLYSHITPAWESKTNKSPILLEQINFSSFRQALLHSNMRAKKVWKMRGKQKVKIYSSFFSFILCSLWRWGGFEETFFK